jgi:hypothetical protein
MKHLPLIALALLFSFPAFSFDENFRVKTDYKEVQIVFGNVSENRLGLTLSDLIDGIERLLDNFILKYLEANMDVSSPQNGYITPNPTTPKSNGRNTPLLPRLP